MIIVNENIFNELSEGKQKVFYAMVRIPTLQKLQDIARKRQAVDIGLRGSSKRIVVHLNTCMALSAIHEEKQAMRIKIKLIATSCGACEDIGDSFNGYELESLNY